MNDKNTDDKTKKNKNKKDKSKKDKNKKEKFYKTKEYEKLQKKKRALRRRAVSERKSKDHSVEDSSISEHLCSFLLEAPPESIICSYLAMPDEFPTAPLLESLHKERKDFQFFVPRIESGVREGAKMHFYALSFDSGKILWSALEEDSRGIFQPSDDGIKLKTKKLKDRDITLYFIMPGLYFDEKGYRIGYGGGYYDRYLRRHPADRVLIAPCRAIQFSDKDLPFSERDVPVDLLATAEGIRCSNKKLNLNAAQNAMLLKD